MALKYDKIILFGDSITEGASNQENGFGLGAALQHAYSRKLDVLLRGFGGFNSDHGVMILDKIIEQEHSSVSKIKLLIIFFGTNDSAFRGNPQNVNVPIGRFQDNIRRMVKSAELAGIPPILIGPAPFNAQKFAVSHPEFDLDRTTLLQRQYCDAITELAAELVVPSVPLWYVMMAEIGWKEGDPIHGLEELEAPNPLEPYFYDGLHFSGTAYEAEFRGMMRAICAHYPNLDPESIKSKLPDWNELHSLEVLESALQKSCKQNDTCSELPSLLSDAQDLT